MITKFLALLFLSLGAHAQIITKSPGETIFFSPSTCGYYRPYDSTGQWITIDTIGVAVGAIPDWVYTSKVEDMLVIYKAIDPFQSRLVPPMQLSITSRRIDRNSGIRQIRKVYTAYRWVECPKTAYETTEDSLLRLHPRDSISIEYALIRVDSAYVKPIKWSRSKIVDSIMPIHVNRKIWMKRADCPCKLKK